MDTWNDHAISLELPIMDNAPIIDRRSRQEDLDKAIVLSLQYLREVQGHYVSQTHHLSAGV